MHNNNLPLPFWVTHWLRFVCMIVLVASGFYIARPFIAPAIDFSAPVNFLQAEIRFWHVTFGWILLSATLIKTYLFFFGRKFKTERESIGDVFSPKQWISRVKFYLTLSGKVRDNGLYNPLQFVTYFFVYVALYGIILTGIVLFVSVYHDGMMSVVHPFFKYIEVLMGGIANVRWVHHILTWVFLIFLPIHIYMASMKFLYKKSYDKAHS